MTTADHIIRTIGSVEKMRESIENMTASLNRMRLTLERMNARREVRWYVIGAMDPLYAHPDRRDEMVKALAATVGGGCAAAFLRGWVEHRSH